MSKLPIGSPCKTKTDADYEEEFNCRNQKCKELMEELRIKYKIPKSQERLAKPLCCGCGMSINPNSNSTSSNQRDVCNELLKDGSSHDPVDFTTFLIRWQEEERKQRIDRAYSKLKEEKQKNDMEAEMDNDDDNNDEDEDDDEDNKGGGGADDLFFFFSKHENDSMLGKGIREARRGKQRDVPPHVRMVMERDFIKFDRANSGSMLKKLLDRQLYDKIKGRTTETYASTLMDCIQSGLQHFDAPLGLYAAEEGSYQVFKDLFDRFFRSYHCFGEYDIHPCTYYGKPSDFGPIDPKQEYITKIQIKFSRSLEDFPFAPIMTKAEFKQVENIVKCNLSSLFGDLKGNYCTWANVDISTKRKLAKASVAINKGDHFLESAQVLRYWPVGRGIFVNEKKNFFVWCNESDHLALIFQQEGSDIASLYKRCIKGMNQLSNLFNFVQNDRLGYVTIRPTLLGSAMQISAFVILKYLATREIMLMRTADRFRLLCEIFDPVNRIVKVTNKFNLGFSEYQTVKMFIKQVKKLIRAEQEIKHKVVLLEVLNETFTD